jgi:hypothetical protein
LIILKINEIFDRRINLIQSELVTQFIIDKDYLSLPYNHIKKTKNEKIDYPLLTIASLKKENTLRLAFSGLCSFPGYILQ